MKKVILLILVTFLLASCQPSPSQTVEKGSNKLESFKSLIESEFVDWINSAREKDEKFSIEGMIKVSEGVINIDYTTDFNIRVNSEIRNFYPFSPDNSKYVDVYAGYYVENRPEGDVIVFGGYDDSSGINLVDLNNNEIERLKFCGISCRFNDATWIDDNSFIVVGRSFLESEECLGNETMCEVPVLYYYNLQENVEIVYYGNKINVQ